MGSDPPLYPNRLAPLPEKSCGEEAERSIPARQPKGHASRGESQEHQECREKFISEALHTMQDAGSSSA